MKIKIHYIFFSIIALSSLVYSCRTAKDVTDQNTKRLNDKEVEELLFSKDSLPFFFVYAKIGVDFKNNVRSNSFKATVKMKTDSAFSGTLSVGPVIGGTYLVTADSIFFTDKINDCYFKENLNFLSDLFGTTIEYDFFQSLVLGMPIGLDYSIKYNIRHTRDYYILSSYKNRDLRKIDQDGEDNIFVQYYLNTETLELDKIGIQVPTDTVTIDIDFKTRELVDSLMFPKQTSIKIVHPRDSIFIDLDYGSIKINERKEIDINIPPSYVKCK